MKGHIKSKIFLMLLAFILFVSACGKTSEDSTEGKSESESGSEVADEIVFAPNTDAQNLDPHVLNDNTSMQVSKMIYSALLKYDENNDIVGDVAEDWEVSDDGLEWTFYLRDGVTFHDGAKLDAEAVKKNFERVLDENNALVHRAYFEMITDIEVIDDLTIVFKTDEPFAPFEAHMSVTGAGIISPNAIDEFGNDLGQNVDSIIGSGPYKIVEWNKDEQMILERFDDYHGETPPTKRIVYKPILEDSTRLIALETGEVDVIQGIPANELERLESLDNVVVSSEVGNGNRFFRFDTSKAPLDDPLVRQAISYAVDRDAIVDNLFPGAAQVATSAITSSVWGYKDLGPIPQDIEKAKALLKEAGYEDGFDIKISTTERYALGIELAEVLSEQLKEVGITAQIDVREWTDISSEWSGLTPDEFDQGIFIMGGAPPSLDADRGLRANYYTSETNELNYGFYSNSEYDELVNKAKSEIDPEKRQELYDRAQEIIYLEDPASIWLFDIFILVAQNESVKDLNISPLTMITFEKAYKEK